jgi:hypothetical protein
MKSKRLTLSVILSTVLLTTMSLFFVEKASALGDNKKKQLKACIVQSGGTVTQLGNTCESGGDGCSANPCGE